MNTLSTFAVMAGLFLAAPAQAATEPAPETGALEYAIRIVDTIMPPEKRDDMTMSLMRTISDQMRDAIMGQVKDPGLGQILDAYLANELVRIRPATERHMPLILRAMAQAYVREFSLDELRQISAFARTPTGAHYLSRGSALLGDPEVAAANRAYYAEVSQDALASQAALRDAVTSYLAKHPDVARKIAQQGKTTSDQ